MKRANIIISIILIVFGVFFASLTSRLPDRNLPNTLGGAFMPWLMVILLLFLSILLLVKNIISGAEIKRVDNISLKDGLRILLLTTIVFIYVNAMQFFGFLLTTPFFIISLMLISGSKNWKQIVLVSLAGSGAIYFFFHKLFQVPLPGGKIF
jgi:hypothetical protein